ncbi:hypothetical protein I5192_13565 [Ruegeria sp. SCSIO 43209]|uniref:hypothetical protein n=1 Tax=Ruegeria sp. SCSIO 43209 TaxID=2793010 RepID=UPI00147C56AD|nr:hypothetical protein [Ruegeria sp. SCSIO 43209]UAB88248.1 hypothetical protein I5192_13565 [Ruegeria sp. SCSIO 43209]
MTTPPLELCVDLRGIPRVARLGSGDISPVSVNSSSFMSVIWSADQLGLIVPLHPLLVFFGQSQTISSPIGDDETVDFEIMAGEEGVSVSYRY